MECQRAAHAKYERERRAKKRGQVAPKVAPPAAPKVPGEANPEEWVRLVWMVASQLAKKARVEPGELVGEGWKGLMDALRLFDPSKGVKFSTYAPKRILGAMLDARRKEIGRGRSRSREISFSELEDGSPDWEDPVAPEIEDTSEELAKLRRVLEGLPERTRAALLADRRAGLTLKEVGEQFGVGESRIAQIRKQALVELRETIVRAPDVVYRLRPAETPDPRPALFARLSNAFREGIEVKKRENIATMERERRELEGIAKRDEAVQPRFYLIRHRHKNRKGNYVEGPYWYARLVDGDRSKSVTTRQTDEEMARKVAVRLLERFAHGERCTIGRPLNGEGLSDSRRTIRLSEPLIADIEAVLPDMELGRAVRRLLIEALSFREVYGVPLADSVSSVGGRV